MMLKDRVAIVTGGGNGIGRAYCRGLAKEGAKVVAADIDFPGAKETKRLVEQDKGTALALQVDVAEEKSTLAMAEATIKAFGKIDILINNAGILVTVPISRVSFDKITIEEWDRVMAVNLKGMWLCCRAVVPYMKKQSSGKIINISSGAIYQGRGKRVHYIASKAGVIGLTRGLARELGEFGITVNTLVPGSTLSEAKKDAKDVTHREEATATRCLKRIQLPEDMVGAAVFMSSSASDFMTGQSVLVDGGRAMI